MSPEPDKYLGVLKASYDYTPQSDDEIAIQQDQQLLLVEKVDDDWWRVKVTGTEGEIGNQIGLVPAAYVEQAPHTSVMKVLYDYEATDPGELTVRENDILLVFETEEDWLLVQNSGTGSAGYVPGNYVEVVDEDVIEESSPAHHRIIVPDSPPKPAYIDPADRAVSVKVSADDIKTWSVSEVDKKGKKKKGTLGIGNGSLFFASEIDKAPVQKWEIKDVVNVSSEKAKHVKVDIAGSSPASLHFHISSREHADAVLEKLATSRALLKSERETERFAVETDPSPSKMPSVHFSTAAPTIIPDSEDQERSSLKNEKSEIVVALYDFKADGEDELTVKEGERLTVIERDGEEWWKCINEEGIEGVVPASYLESEGQTEAVNGGVQNEPSLVEQPRTQTQRDKDRLEQPRHEREKEENLAPAEVPKDEIQKSSTPAAQRERLKKKTMSPPAVSHPEPSGPASPENHTSSDVSRPSPQNTRTWHDRTGQFRVEAAFLGFNNGKLRLHKVNGVIVEVPSEKMSLEDMYYVEKLMEKKTKASVGMSDDDIPLGVAMNAKPATKSSKKIDWFDFFLSAGCDVDDCTRYSAAFENDKIDETLLNDITEGTMRSLGLREGDIIRLKKAIVKRKPADNLQKHSARQQEQIRTDEELARQLQAQENATTRTPAPNLFAGPGGVLKPRRGRPQPSKTLPPNNVDLTAISSAAGYNKSDELPTIGTLPPRPKSATAASAPLINSGFEDDAWTNRPSSAKLVKPTNLTNTDVSSTPSPPRFSAPTPTSLPKPEPTQSTQASSQGDNEPSKHSKNPDAEVFDQLARLSDLRKNSNPRSSQQSTPNPTIISPPGYSAGLGMGPSSLSLGQLTNSTIVSAPPAQTSNGPRGPYAPVPANQGLLQPLIPTQTGFGGFIPTKPTHAPLSFQTQLSTPSFIPSQTTGFHSHSPVLTHPTGSFGNFGGVPFHSKADNFMPTSQPFMNPSPFSNPGLHGSSPDPINKDTSPASVFAQMKLGTFAQEDNGGLNGQAPSWGHQPYQTYMGH